MVLNENFRKKLQLIITFNNFELESEEKNESGNHLRIKTLYYKFLSLRFVYCLL